MISTETHLTSRLFNTDRQTIQGLKFKPDALRGLYEGFEIPSGLALELNEAQSEVKLNRVLSEVALRDRFLKYLKVVLRGFREITAEYQLCDKGRVDLVIWYNGIPSAIVEFKKDMNLKRDQDQLIRYGSIIIGNNLQIKTLPLVLFDGFSFHIGFAEWKEAGKIGFVFEDALHRIYYQNTDGTPEVNKSELSILWNLLTFCKHNNDFMYKAIGEKELKVTGIAGAGSSSTVFIVDDAENKVKEQEDKKGNAQPTMVLKIGDRAEVEHEYRVSLELAPLGIVLPVLSYDFLFAAQLVYPFCYHVIKSYWFPSDDVKLLNLDQLWILWNKLKLMHVKEYVHRDIRLENILVARRTDEPYYIDLGFACNDGETKEYCGTEITASQRILALLSQGQVDIKACPEDDLESFNKLLYICEGVRGIPPKQKDAKASAEALLNFWDVKVSRIVKAETYEEKVQVIEDWWFNRFDPEHIPAFNPFDVEGSGLSFWPGNPEDFDNASGSQDNKAPATGVAEDIVASATSVAQDSVDSNLSVAHSISTPEKQAVNVTRVIQTGTTPMPKKCGSCSELGHTARACPKNKAIGDDEMKGTVNASENIAAIIAHVVEKKTEEVKEDAEEPIVEIKGKKARKARTGSAEEAPEKKARKASGEEQK